MRRTRYNLVVELKESVQGIRIHRYNGFPKVKYKMKGDNAKIWIYSLNGNVEIKEFSNVASVEVQKCKI